MERKSSKRDNVVSILRGWSSAVTLLEGTEQLWRGGGYFVKWAGKGIVIDPGFDFLRNFQLCSDDVHAFKEHDNLAIEIKGSWFHTLPWEVLILSSLNEIYFRGQGDLTLGRKNLQDKIQLVRDVNADTDYLATKHPFKFACFGLR